MSVPPPPTPRANGLFAWVVSHPVATAMIAVAFLVFGYVSYQRLAVELMPDISYPTITVRTAYDGAAPQEVEAQVSRPVEEALATLDGLVTLDSRSRAGVSDVVLGFDWGTDMSGALQTIRENLQTTWLPEEADRPLILRYDPSLDPFLRLAMDAGEAFASGNDAETLYRLRELADGDFKRELEGVKGVAAVRIRGGLEREIHVAVREDWLAARRLSLEQVQQALGAENINVAGGSILEGDTEYMVRTLNEYATVDELSSLQIRRADGVLVPLTDVAVITEAFREREVLSRLNGGEAVELEVFKEAGSNVVEVAHRVQEALEGVPTPTRTPDGEFELESKGGLRSLLPEGVGLTVVEDQASFIEDSVANLRDTAILGGLLAVGILFLFLRDFRSTAIIGLAIPMSVVISFAPLYLLGISLNLMSLGGLALGIGMLVDNAVVVLESIGRYREEGKDRFDAAVLGVSDVALAVTASTLTTVAVFFPIAFVEGVGGELFGDLSLAVVASLLASLAVALFVVPTLAAFELDWVPDPEDRSAITWLRDYSRADGPGLRAVLAGLWGVATGPALREWRVSWATGRGLRRIFLPWQVLRLVLRGLTGIAAVVAAVVSAVVARFAWWIVGFFQRGFARAALGVANGFNVGYRRVEGSYERLLRWSLRNGGLVIGLSVLAFAVSLGLLSRVGTELIPEVHQGRFAVDLALPVGTPLEVTSRLSEEAERIAADHPDVRVVYAQVGADSRTEARSDEGEHTARLRIALRPTGDPETLETRVMEDLRAELTGLSERLTVKMSRPSLFSVRTPVEVVVYGWDLDQLRLAGEEVAEKLSAVPGLRDVRSSQAQGHPEVQLRYDRPRLHRLGLDPATVAARVRDKIQGVVATNIHRAEHRIDLRVQLVEPDRGSLDDLRRINVNPNLLPVIPLDTVADFDEAVSPSEIRRVDQQRAVVVSANLEGFDLGSAGTAITGALSELQLPEELTVEVGGQFSEMNQSLSSLRFALLLAVFLVYVIMASTFENIIHPFVILFSVPLAVVGTAVLLWVVGIPISVVVFIGAIVLAGVVVNNAIVLVDTINRQRAEGLERGAAIRRAGQLRLRPILITTATTVLGLLPLSLGYGAGAEIQQPLAIAVIGGLSSSTLLTLVVVPIVYRTLSRSKQVEARPAPDGVLEGA